MKDKKLNSKDILEKSKYRLAKALAELDEVLLIKTKDSKVLQDEINELNSKIINFDFEQKNLNNSLENIKAFNREALEELNFSIKEMEVILSNKE